MGAPQPARAPQRPRSPRTPLALRVVVTAFVAILVPVYWQHYGVLHFLWISDLALFATLVVLWRGSRLVNSMLVLGALPFELFWNLGFWGQLATGHTFGGLAAYMFDTEQSLLLRGLSLFHVPLPLIWLYFLWKWGYDARALRLQTLVLAAIVLATYALTDPAKNINWVFVPAHQGWEWVGSGAWVALYLVTVPLLVYWPLHSVLRRWRAAR